MTLEAIRYRPPVGLVAKIAADQVILYHYNLLDFSAFSYAFQPGRPRGHRRGPRAKLLKHNICVMQSSSHFLKNFLTRYAHSIAFYPPIINASM